MLANFGTGDIAPRWGAAPLTSASTNIPPAPGWKDVYSTFFQLRFFNFYLRTIRHSFRFWKYPQLFSCPSYYYYFAAGPTTGSSLLLLQSSNEPSYNLA